MSMDEWQTMFRGVQTITRSTNSFGEGLEQIIWFARKNPKLFDEPDYWDRVEQHRFPRPANRVINWAKEGVENLDYKENWEFLILDLGDCPEIFSLYSPGSQALLAEVKLRKLLLDDSVIGAEELEQCFASDVGDPFQRLYGDERAEWVYHNVSELNDELLSWNVGGSVEFHGNNGYLLWLAVGSLALLEPLRNLDYCKQILHGRSRLYLLSGFESIFLHLATVTPEGLLFEGDIKNTDEGFLEADQMRLPLADGDS